MIDRFYHEPYADVSGLVVDAKHRNQGAGRILMDAAVSWARERGFPVLRLKTNALRKDAHRFYERYGFERAK